MPKFRTVVRLWNREQWPCPLRVENRLWDLESYVRPPPHHIRTTVEYTSLHRGLAICCVCRVEEVCCNPPWWHEMSKEEFPSGDRNVPCQGVGNLEIVILE